MQVSEKNISPKVLSKKINKKKSFTFIEIIISSIILAVCMGGLLATFVSVRRAVSKSNRRLAGVNTERKIVEGIFSNVTANDANALCPGDPASVLDGVTYNYNCNVNPAPAGCPTCRQVNVNVTLPDVAGGS